jgi:hypothetical protein
MPVVKLYVAETYRPNLGGALLHLDGARAAYSRLNTWLALDPNYILTLCESGESYLLPGVQPTPIAFPTIADPGPAISYSPDGVAIVHILGDGVESDTPQTCSRT